MDWKHNAWGHGIDVYFSVCPFCFSEKVKSEFGSGLPFSKDHVICTECGAKWEVGVGKSGFSIGKLKWAKLIVIGIDEKGSEFLNEKKKPDFWQRMALKGRRAMPKTVREPVPVKEKEIIREIVKIRCPYCRALYDESNDKCPHCSGAR